MLASKGTTLDGRSRTQTWTGGDDGVLDLCMLGALNQGREMSLMSHIMLTWHQLDCCSMAPNLLWEQRPQATHTIEAY